MCTGKCLSLIPLTLGIFLSLTSKASGVEIGDPKNILSAMSYQGPRAEFEKAFTCMKPASFFIRSGICKVHCEFSMCEENCAQNRPSEGQLQIEDCNQDSLHLYSSFGLALDITKQDYQSSSNSLAKAMARSTLQYYDSFEYLEITNRIFPVARILIENGQLKRFSTAIIHGSAYPNRLAPESIGFEIELDLSKNGLDQLMCVAVGNDCTSDGNGYIFKRKGLKHGYQ